MQGGAGGGRERRLLHSTMWETVDAFRTALAPLSLRSFFISFFIFFACSLGYGDAVMKVKAVVDLGCWVRRGCSVIHIIHTSRAQGSGLGAVI
jgi:hypothetical protein